MQEDPNERSVEVLERISTQLASFLPPTALSNLTATEGKLSTFHPTGISVAINAVWFLSLTFALLAALFAILIQQWLRQYASLPQVTGRARAHLRQRRYKALREWFVPQLISALSVLLQLTLFLFLGGLIAFLWTVNTAVAIVITAAVGIFFLVFALTTILPAILVECPYRSPLAWFFYVLLTPVFQSIVRRLYGVLHWLLWHVHRALPPRSPLGSSLAVFRYQVIERWRARDIAPASWYAREVQHMDSPDFERDIGAVLWASRAHSSAQVEWIAHCLLDSMNPSTALFYWIANTARPLSTYNQVLEAAKSKYELMYARGNWLHKDEDRDVARALLDHACLYSLAQSPSVPDINEKALLNMIPYLMNVSSPSHIKSYLMGVLERPDTLAEEWTMVQLAQQMLEQHRAVSEPQTQLPEHGTLTLGSVAATMLMNVLGSLRIARWSLHAFDRLELPDGGDIEPDPPFKLSASHADAFESSALAAIAARLREMRTDDGPRPVIFKTLFDHLIRYVLHPAVTLRCPNRVWFEELDHLIRNLEQNQLVARDPSRQRFPPAEATRLVDAFIEKNSTSWTNFEVQYVFGTLPTLEPQRPHLRTYLLTHYSHLQSPGTSCTFFTYLIIG